VVGSKTKIYIVLEYITGGELFDTIVSHILHCQIPSIVVSAIPTLLCFTVLKVQFGNSLLTKFSVTVNFLYSSS
jgi:hypothetical protein